MASSVITGLNSGIFFDTFRHCCSYVSVYIMTINCYSFFLAVKMSKNMNAVCKSMYNIIDFITNGDVSDLSDFSDDESSNEQDQGSSNICTIKQAATSILSNVSHEDEEDDFPLAALQQRPKCYS